MKTVKLTGTLLDARKTPIQKPPQEGGGPADFRYIAVSTLERPAQVPAEELNLRGLLAERIVEAKDTIDLSDEELTLLRKSIPEVYPIPPIVVACNRVMDAAEAVEEKPALAVKKGGKK